MPAATSASAFITVTAHPRRLGHGRLIAEQLGRGPRDYAALAFVRVGQHQVEKARKPFGIDLHADIVLRAFYSTVDP